MSTIHMHETTTLTPAQYIAGLIDFGPGCRELFSNSADEHLKVHSRGPRRPTSPKAREEFGNDCITTGPIRTMSSSPQPTPIPGEGHPATPTRSHDVPTV